MAMFNWRPRCAAVRRNGRLLAWEWLMRALFGFLYAPRAAMMAGPVRAVDDADFRRWEAEAARRRHAVRAKMQEIWDVVAEPWPGEANGAADAAGSNAAAPEGQVPEA